MIALIIFVGMSGVVFGFLISGWIYKLEMPAHQQGRTSSRPRHDYAGPGPLGRLLSRSRVL